MDAKDITVYYVKWLHYNDDLYRGVRYSCPGYFDKQHNAWRNK